MSERKILYVDAFSGVSGDMFLAAIMDCGFALKNLESELSKLGVRGYKIRKRTVKRGGIRATLLEIDVSKTPAFPKLSDAERLIGGSSLDDGVKAKVIDILRCLAAAEAKVHGRRRSHVHFHELGDFDTILDLVGTVSGLKHLGVDRVYSSSIPLGKGMIDTDHGKLAAPAPATVEILKGCPVRMTNRMGELTTPTGAALIKILSDGFSGNIGMRVRRVGYGAGTRVGAGLPNLLRVFLAAEESPVKERAYVIEANIDDMDPQVYTYLFEKLRSEEVLDVYLTPVQMKKSRPGVLLTVIMDESRLDRVADILLSETMTIGLRYWEVGRRIAHRKIKKIMTSMGEVRVKEVDIPPSSVRRKIEFEDLVRLARKTGKSLIDVQRRLQAELDLTLD